MGRTAIIAESGTGCVLRRTGPRPPPVSSVLPKQQFIPGFFSPRPPTTLSARSLAAPRERSERSELDSLSPTDLSEDPFLFHPDDDLAFCTSRFDISHSLFGRFEWKDPIHKWAYDPGIDERTDLA